MKTLTAIAAVFGLCSFCALAQDAKSEATPTSPPKRISAIEAEKHYQETVVVTGKVAHDGGLFSVDSAVRAGSPVIPVALKLPVESLAPGAYRAELRATDSMGRQTVLRATDFDLEP